MKVVINNCYGGFSLSPKAVRAYYERKGRSVYFFQIKFGAELQSTYIPVSEDEATGYNWCAFDVPNPNEVLNCGKTWKDQTREERLASNELHRKHDLNSRPENRADADLIEVVESLGDAANGAHANLKVVEIPDDIEWEIDEYDGAESVEEKHRSWY